MMCKCSQLTLIIPTKNEGKNLERCLLPIYRWAKEIIVVDSGSTDETLDIAKKYSCTILQFDYKGGWPKKRQWVLDTYDFKTDWVFLLDADEILDESIKREIEIAILSGDKIGYWIKLEIFFLGKQLKYGDTSLRKLSLFRVGHGNFEQRVLSQDASMADMEVHEHVVVDGATANLMNPIRHENLNSISRYIIKHNEYSNWEMVVALLGETDEIIPKLLGNQAQRRRWLKSRLMWFPATPLLYFLYLYILRLGFLDGKQGFYHAIFKGIQLFHIKAKIYEELLRSKVIS